CHTYAPDEPDLRHVKKYRIGDDLSERDNAKAMMRPGVFARVYNSWRTYNPAETPTIGFGPDVAGSLYLAERFSRKVFPASHIDGEEVWVNGRQYKSSHEARDDVLEDAKNGEIKIVFNRYCLREGIDMPWLSHAIFATVFGSLSSYLQAGGRLLRSHPT